jgi:hypothetical protein
MLSLFLLGILAFGKIMLYWSPYLVVGALIYRFAR